MLCAVSLLLAFLHPAGSQTSSNMEMGMISVTRTPGSHLTITCDLHTEKSYVHWYRFREGQAPQRLLYYDQSSSKVMLDSGFRPGKYNAYQATWKSNKFVARNVEESDSGVYYCAIWAGQGKVFGGGTKLVVTDKDFRGDISPKPTIFLPSVTEIKSHQAGTYLCLLENFFPDIIKISWKEKDGKRVLKSSQGDTMKTSDTYMKFSWLTVTGNSMDKEHQCIVTHQNNKGGVDQEILFPPVGKVGTHSNPTEASLKEDVVTTTTAPEAFLKGEDVVNTTNHEALLKGEKDLLSLHLANISAYYTYLLLLLKSTLHGILLTSCLCRRSAVCGARKST